MNGGEEKRFRIVTDYDLKTMTVMSRVLRKTVRKKRNRRAHVLGWLAAVFGILYVLLRQRITFGTVLILAGVLLFEDRINGIPAVRHMAPGTERAAAVFTPEGYSSETELGVTRFYYDRIAALAETPEYFVFLFDENHAQAYDKSRIVGGTADEFRRFIETAAHGRVEPVS